MNPIAVRVLDPIGNVVQPLQIKVLSYWENPIGEKPASIKWLQLSFMADMTVDWGNCVYTLAYSPRVAMESILSPPTFVESPLTVREDETSISVDTGKLKLSIIKDNPFFWTHRPGMAGPG